MNQYIDTHTQPIHVKKEKEWNNRKENINSETEISHVFALYKDQLQQYISNESDLYDFEGRNENLGNLENFTFLF